MSTFFVNHFNVAQISAAPNCFPKWKKKMSESQPIIQEENKQPMLEEDGIFCSGVNSEPEHY